MKCLNCKNELRAGEMICSRCGMDNSAQYTQQVYQNGQQIYQNGQPQMYQNGGQQMYQNGVQQTYQNGQQMYQNSQQMYQNGQQMYQNSQQMYQNGQQMYQNGQQMYQNSQQPGKIIKPPKQKLQFDESNTISGQAETDKPENRSSKGIIIGIYIGLVVLIIVAAIIIFITLFGGDKDKSDKDEKTTTEVTTEELSTGNETTTEETTTGVTTTEATTEATIEAITEAAKPSTIEERMADPNGYILETSNTSVLTASDIQGMTKEQLRYARNEIYARHGRLFNDSTLQNYFNQKSWYHGTINPDDFQESMLSECEKANTEFIKQAEDGM